jgi:UDP-glucose 4-epimerase
MLAGIQPVIYGDGSKTRDYIFIEDVVRANVAALERGDGEIFNIASGLETSDQQVFDVIRDRLGKSDLRAKYVARRPGEIEKIYLDIRKAERILGWTPQISLSEGARRTVSYFQQTANKMTAQH